jgi:CDP-glycerol glycerophosphotransferase (TagB/SpsB family)
VSDLVVRLRALVVRVTFGIARFLPLRPRVVLATAHDAALRGNLVVIHDALRAADPPIPVTVLAHASRGDLRGRIRALGHAALAGYHLATARLFIVDDYYFPVYVIRPRPGTVIVQTWHASGAFKKFGLSVLDKSFGATEALTRRVRIHGNYDICLVSSRACAVFYAEAFGQPVERFRPDLGIPRTDALFDSEAIARTAAAVRARYGIAPGKRVILYAPTFRGDSIGAAVAGPMLDLPLLRDRLGADHALLLRLHPFVRAGLTITPDLADFVIDASEHPEINDLLVASDVLVTDYSSVIFEYALLRRPMVFFAPDLDAYEGERGFYFDYRSGVPGPVCATTEEVADHLRAGTPDPERIDRFRAWAFDVADGHATERFVERIVRPALAGTLETGPRDQA